MIKYDLILIHQFLINHLDLRLFCFVLEHKLNSNYNYSFLPEDGLINKSLALVNLAKKRAEVGDLICHIVQYWLKDIYGNPRVLIDEGMIDQLGIFIRELLARDDKNRAIEILNLLKEYLPAANLKNLLPEPELPAAPGKQQFRHGYAVLVGVGRQKDLRIPSLPATVSDARAIQEVLIDPTRCAYPGEHVQLLTEDGATREAILNNLAWLAERANEDSRATAIFYFSGHGWKDQRANPPCYCLIPYDFNRDKAKETAVYDDVFMEKLDAIQAERLVIILDACHAGGLTKEIGEDLPIGFIKSAPPATQLFARLNSGSGRIIFSSSKENEYSYILRNRTRSIFTDCFVEALSGRAPSARPGEVGILDVFNYLDLQVPIVVGAEGHRHPDTSDPAQQHPVLDSAKTNNFPIALVRGGAASAGN